MNGRHSQTMLTDHLVGTGAFRTHPVRVVDVGAAGGAERLWKSYRDQLHLIGFDPDPEECARLNALRPGHEYVPIALDRVPQARTLNVTRAPGASSLLQVNASFVDQFAQRIVGEVIRQQDVATTTLDGWMSVRQPGPIDFLKVDVEGAELEVLAGAKESIGSAFGLSVELFFQPYHVGRPLFGEVDVHVRREGFVLMDLPHIERWRRRAVGLPGWKDGNHLPQEWYGAGQVIWAQGIYMRTPDAVVEDIETTHAEDPSRLLKALSLYEVFGLADLGVQVLDQATVHGIVMETDTVSARAMLVGSARNQWRAKTSRQRKVTQTKRLCNALVPSVLKPAAKELYVRIFR